MRKEHGGRATSGCPGAWVRGCLGLLVVVGALGGCHRLALGPAAHRLEGEWQINGEESYAVPRGAVVLVELRLRNVAGWPVRLPAEVKPRLTGEEPGGTWTLLQEMPEILPAGGETRAWWRLEVGMKPGLFGLGIPTADPFLASSAELRVEDVPLSSQGVIGYRATLARLTGQTVGLARELIAEAVEGELLPATRLLAGDLFAEGGETGEALIQYERFAEEVYGVDGLPGWLRGRMRAVAKGE